MIDKMISDLKEKNERILSGKIAFELYDTYGFPADLTQLILKENGMTLDTEGFETEMKNQKDRSRADGTLDAGDWIIIRENDDTVFTGYDRTMDNILITKYRVVNQRKRDMPACIRQNTFLCRIRRTGRRYRYYCLRIRKN